MTTRKIQRYGWKPDLPDFRDHAYLAPGTVLSSLPKSVDLRSQCPSVYDQGQLGSCTANAITGALEFDLLKQKLADFTPSRLFIYYNERVIEHDTDQDNGAQIRDGMKSVAKQGFCPETDWPYDISRFAVAPGLRCYQDAQKNKSIAYKRVSRSLQAMRGCLAAGYPFVFGFSVYSSFESEQVAQSGVLDMPQPDEQAIGGHAVLAVGYDDGSQRFLVRNSWGSQWGQQGYFTMPYAYLLHSGLSSDFWQVQTVS